MSTRRLCSLKQTHSAARWRQRRFALWAAILAFLVSAVDAQEIQILRAKPDPYGYPRPAPGESNVPVASSFFLQIGFEDKNTTDAVLLDSVSVRIGPRGGPAVDVLKPGRHFTNGYSGKVFPSWKRRPSVVVCIDGGADLKPSTTYTVSVSARSQGGAVLSGEKGTWQFTTEDVATTHRLRFALDLSTPPVRWHGGFFTGFCKPSFCTSASNRIPGTS